MKFFRTGGWADRSRGKIVPAKWKAKAADGSIVTVYQIAFDDGGGGQFKRWDELYSSRQEAADRLAELYPKGKWEEG